MSAFLSRPLISILAAASLSAGLAACGGSSSSTLSRSDLVAKANAICASTQAAGKRIALPANIQDATAAAKYFNAAVPVVEKGVSQLKALKPDSSVSADWNAYTTALQTSLTRLRTIQAKANAHDPSGLADLQNLNTQQVDAAAKKVGATKCA